jgi:peroxiredoxin Q/BCP
VRDALPQFKELNVAVVGISPDKPAQQKKFDDKYSLGFPLLSDPEHQIAEAYGVWSEKKMYGKTYMGIVRSAFLINADGQLTAVWYKISPKDTVPELIKALESG